MHLHGQIINDCCLIEKYNAQLAIANAAAQADDSITAADREGVNTGIWLEGVNPNGTQKGKEWKYNKRIHSGAETETFVCNLPSRGVYIAKAGTKSWMIRY